MFRIIHSFFRRKETEQTFMRDHNHVIKNIDNYISSLKTLATKPSNEIGIMNILRTNPAELTEQDKNSNYYYIQMFLFRESMLTQENCESIFLYSENTAQYYGISNTYIIRDNDRYYDFSRTTKDLTNISYDKPIFISGIRKNGMKIKPLSNHIIDFNTKEFLKIKNVLELLLLIWIPRFFINLPRTLK